MSSAACAHCGVFHPYGTSCIREPHTVETTSSTEEKDPSAPEPDPARATVHTCCEPGPCSGFTERSHPDSVACGCGQEHEHTRNHGSCCSHDHAAAEPVDLSLVKTASPTRAVYRILNMDCPMEETLIRTKLGTVKGITGLEFNLMQRVLTVDHTLASTKPIEEALCSIDMKPEPLGQRQGSIALFTVADMDCPTEEGLIRAKLSGMPEVLGLEFNLMQRTLKIRHEPAALPAIAAALDSLRLGSTLVEANADVAQALPEPAIPWRKLILAGIFAILSETFELIHEWGIAPFGMDMSAWKLGNSVLIDHLPLVLAVLAIMLAGLTTYKKGWIAIRTLNLNINALMSVAVTGAVIIGQYPEAAMVMVLFNIAEAIEAKALDRARNAIKNLLALAPEKATLQGSDGIWTDVDIRRIAVGQSHSGKARGKSGSGRRCRSGTVNRQSGSDNRRKHACGQGCRRHCLRGHDQRIWLV